jgi:alpha-1,6-mannosyltransferase
VNISPVRKLGLLGAVICLALFVCARMPEGAMGAYYLVPLAVAGGGYLLAARELFRTPQYPRQIIFACLALAALWRVPFLLKPIAAQDDLRRYVWDGRLQHLGRNPYTSIPDDPNLAALHTDETLGMNNPGVTSPYPAGAQLFFRAVTAISQTTFAFKIAFVFCDFAIVWVLIEVLRRTRQPLHWVLAYAWHPAVATEIAGAGHVDIVGALLLLISFLAIIRSWRILAAVTFALAVAVKFLPLVLLPLYWRRVRLRDALAAIATFALLYVPFFDHGRIPLGSIGVFVQRFRFNDPIFAVVERLANPGAAAGLALLAGLSSAMWLRHRHQEPTPQAWAWPMAASLACAPVVYPWYLLWLIPFLRPTAPTTVLTQLTPPSSPMIQSRPSTGSSFQPNSSSALAPRTLIAQSSVASPTQLASTHPVSLPTPLLIWSSTILSTYYVWHLQAVGAPWQVPSWLTAIEYLPVAAALLLLRKPHPHPADTPLPPQN